MKCAVHPEADAVGYCRNCGKAMCSQCSREVRGALYCETCLAAMMAPPQATTAQFAPSAPAAAYPYVAVEPQGPNPGTALALGFIPGLGAVYNGEYVKGLIHVIIFGGIIAILSANGTPDGMLAILGIFLGVFCCYMPIEAYRTAKAKRMGLPHPGFFGESSVPPVPGADPSVAVQRTNITGSIVLIAVGVIFLLGTTGILSSMWVWRLWPLALVVIGVALIIRRTRG